MAQLRSRFEVMTKLLSPSQQHWNSLYTKTLKHRLRARMHVYSHRCSMHVEYHTITLSAKFENPRTVKLI